MEFETEIRVRYQETDQMGVVYHANYLTWFEIGRTEMIREIGMPYSRFEERGILLPVVDVNIKFKSPARYDDLIKVRTRVAEFTGVRISFTYEVVNAKDEKLLSTGESHHVWVNEDFRPINLMKEWPEMYTLIQEYAD